MANVENFNIDQFLEWLGQQDLANINNHVGDDEAEAADDAEADEAEADDAEIPLEEDEYVDEGIELDCVDMDGECATLSKRLSVRESDDATYCVTVSFVKVPTEVKDYLLCQLCYWRYLDRCHPLTIHRQTSAHKTTDMRRIPRLCSRLYCGVCECNLFTITNIATCTQCNEVGKETYS